MHKNMSNHDRRLRTTLVAPVAVILGILMGPASIVSIILYLVAGVMVATGATGYCPAYSLVHFDSRGQRQVPR